MRLQKFVVFEGAETEIVKTLHRPNAEFQQPKLRHHIAEEVEKPIKLKRELERELRL